LWHLKNRAQICNVFYAELWQTINASSLHALAFITGAALVDDDIRGALVDTTPPST
jgi:hypothetical protein